MSSDVSPAPKMPSVPPASLREYPINAATLVWVLGPILLGLAAIASVTWSRLERLEDKLDRQSDQIADIRVAMATQSGQLDRILALLSKNTP